MHEQEFLRVCAYICNIFQNSSNPLPILPQHYLVALTLTFDVKGLRAFPFSLSAMKQKELCRWIWLWVIEGVGVYTLEFGGVY